MMMFIGFPVTQPRLVLRVGVLCMLAVSLIDHYMLLPYTKAPNTCSYIIDLLYLNLW